MLTLTAAILRTLFFKQGEFKTVLTGQFKYKVKLSPYNFPLVIIAPHNCLVRFAVPSLTATVSIIYFDEHVVISI